jgi:hypothetical protein
MPKRTLRQVVTGQTLVSALPDTTVRAAAVAMANQSVGAILVVTKAAGSSACSPNATRSTGSSPAASTPTRPSSPR